MSDTKDRSTPPPGYRVWWGEWGRWEWEADPGGAGGLDVSGTPLEPGFASGFDEERAEFLTKASDATAACWRHRDAQWAAALRWAADHVDERGMGLANGSYNPENQHAAVRLHRAGTEVREQAVWLRGEADRLDPKGGAGVQPEGGERRKIPRPTLAQAEHYYDSLRADDQAYLRRLWRGETGLFVGHSATRLHGISLVVSRDDEIVLTEKGQVLGEVLLGDRGPVGPEPEPGGSEAR